MNAQYELFMKLMELENLNQKDFAKKPVNVLSELTNVRMRSIYPLLNNWN